MKDSWRFRTENFREESFLGRNLSHGSLCDVDAFLSAVLEACWLLRLLDLELLHGLCSTFRSADYSPRIDLRNRGLSVLH
jgi:hypothetical protein